MYNFKPVLVCKIGGKTETFRETENANFTIDIAADDAGIKCVIHPRRRIELVSFTLEAERPLADGEVFFANGLQSW